MATSYQLKAGGEKPKESTLTKELQYMLGFHGKMEANEKQGGNRDDSFEVMTQNQHGQSAAPI